MTIEQLLIYLVLGGFVFVKYVVDALKRHRAMARQSAPEPAAPEPDEHWWDPVVETARAEVRKEAPPPRAAPPRPAPQRGAARPSPGKPAAHSRQRPPLDLASRHRIALGNRAELRRAVELTAILGPPRARVPEDP